ncbi:nascent polypeptide-associated complex protein [Methanofollis aquaemaris]|uniref:Nascent polypeptide-associated complex protein n=2 Tax=Methanofollis aquaemaris TaxID=126734 RepID=A0A8A3S7X8_9EURY|nr:nascent polypeptide-associated complex protein [Methanofollis aquaemaris]QSZ67831.1 nascent polypeptide-associated complex protein [Methanofollis aquaemaris]
MFPGGKINPKKMKQMMKQLGMQMETLEDVKRVVIETEKGDYVFDEAEVVATIMQGTTTYQINGEARFEPAAVEIPEEDVKLVMVQTNASAEAAKEALTATNGDIAEAIMRLSGA